MLEYKIFESRINTINIDFNLLQNEKTAIDAKANATMKIPTDTNINRVLFEITFEAEEKEQNRRFILIVGEVILEFAEKPDYDKVSQGEYPIIAMNDIVNKADEIISNMGYPDFKFSANEEKEND